MTTAADSKTGKADMVFFRVLAAAEYVQAQPHDGGWAFYAPEVGTWWHVDDDDLEDLYDLLHHEDEQIRGDAYSHWCASYGGECLGRSLEV